MRMVTIVIVVVALAVSGVTAFLIQRFLAAQTPKIEEKHEEIPAERVLVAKINLAAGKLLKEKDHFRWQAWPKADLQPQFIVRGTGAEKEMIGAAVKRGIDAGEPITAARVIKPTDKSFMAAALNPGMRAVSVSVSGAKAVSGFVSPGDRVDLILTLTVKIDAKDVPEGADTDNRKVSEVILRDLRVLAVDQRTRELGTKTKSPGSMTFEVSLKQATVIATARGMGKLSLVLRSHTRGPSQEPRKQFMLTDDTFAFTSELEFLSVLRGGMAAQLARLSQLRTAEFPELRDDEDLEPEAPLPPPEVDKTAEMALNRANQALHRANEAMKRAEAAPQPTPVIEPLDKPSAKPDKPVARTKKTTSKAAAKPPAAAPKAPPPKKATRTEEVTIDRAGKIQTVKTPVAQ